jgi:ABC-2 type transport system permease protein
VIGAAPGTFTAVLRAEVQRNGRRVAPYAMSAVFAGNALLWWAAGPAADRGWATNGEFYIARMLGGFSFMTLPLCTAILMGDPVLRDFVERVDPLIFSKPIQRAGYVLAKFFGSFVVLVACQAVFALTLLALQAFGPAGMIMRPAHVIPYVRHFLFFVVISHLALAALHFAVGTLTRSTRAVYGLAMCLYPLYVLYQTQLAAFPARWRVALDPLLFNWSAEIARGRSAAWLNTLVVTYDADMMANRIAVAFLAAVCLAFVCVRFDATKEAVQASPDERVSTFTVTRARQASRAKARYVIPERWRHVLDPFVAATGVELRLLAAERSLIIIGPLVVLLTMAGPAVYGVRGAEGVASAAYFRVTAETVVLLLVGVMVFYTGEAVHRDREARVEPMLWSTRAPNATFIVPKLVTSVTLGFAILVLVAIASIVVQLVRGSEVDVGVYLRGYVLIHGPTVLVAAALATMLNIVFRDKYAAYIASVAIGTTLFYVYGRGLNNLLYNPALIGRLESADLVALSPMLILHRAYCVLLAGGFIAVAQWRFARRSTRGA